MIAIEKEIFERVSQLDTEQQQQVLAFVRSLALPVGIRGADLIARAHQVNFDPHDLDEMQRAIEQGCERIEPETGINDLFA